MKGYRLDIRSSTYVNGDWKHNNMRQVVVHAINAESARKKAELKPEAIHILGDSEYRISSEYIYSIECLGRVVWEKVARYEK